MTKIISIYPGHNATVALLENNKITKVYNEEKFSNVKNHSGFPVQSINNVTGSDKNLKVVYSEESLFKDYLLIDNNLNSHKQSNENTKTSKKDIIYDRLRFNTINILSNLNLYSKVRDYGVDQNFKKNEKVLINSLKKLKLNFKKVNYVNHHISHAFSPIVFYGLLDYKKPILVFTLDGTGDGISATVNILKDGRFKTISKTDAKDSIGFIYSNVTKILGMTPLEHEYKVMGLAAYSQKKYYQKTYDSLFKDIIVLKKDLTFQNNLGYPTGFSYKHFEKKIVGERFDNVAGALQYFTEKLVLDWIKLAIKKTGINNIAVSGGVFMNVKMNQRILDLDEVQKAWFMPSCGDESNVIGALGYYGYKNKLKIEAMKSTFQGLESTNEDVKDYIKKNNIEKNYKITYCDDIEKKIAELMADFKIVARFKGKGEWGARSLCNRAILGNASKLETFYEVNDLIKMRDFWMPFAPTILDSWASKYIVNWKEIKIKAFDSTKYMILTFDSTKLAQEHLKAGMHQKDKTLRPQVVSKDENPDLYKLLKYYENLTGMG
ncbi:MAG: hypothetical protein KC550_05585, partial [Nanoarchaeota archaeon]|nr:hypothetical protein [Nanoarchaeota archaeon]